MENFNMENNVFFKKKEDLCVAQMLNGLLIIGEKPNSEGMIKNPIAFSYEQEYAEYDEMGRGIGDPKGIGFKSTVIGDPMISRKANALEGIPEIKKYILGDIPKSMCMVCNLLSEINIGSHLLGLYNDVMTKVPQSKLKL